WAGFALVGPQHRVWYSGDTGLHEGLRTVGERLGPFDVTLIEAGQYNTHWPDTHLGPEQAVEAHREVRGKILIPVHWGRLPLAKHAWTEPVERVLVAAQCRDVKVLAPQIGESIEPDAESRLTRWWPTLHWEPAAESPVVATKNGDPLDRIRIPECAAP
ncbi:MAG TPA: MBL fold metallo-hydrolase, partial [Steroidobacteraceae bacterium]|nr:MBL fold metallo-hydrolase [Steroidobacteraceae bacterium]